MPSSDKRAISPALPTRLPLAGALLPLALLLLTPAAHAVTYNVDVSGTNGNYDLSEAMAAAEPGDIVSLADGTYDRAIVSTKDGEAGAPITVVGGRGAVINGDYSSRSVLITHSFITLKGFTVEGKIGTTDTEEAYVNKCVYVEGTGTDSSSPLDGFVMEDLHVENCGGECVRLKDFVINAEITGNTIENCGIHDYVFESGDKNGEGVYIGTSSTQWINGPDACNDNVVSGNTISTSGNECVDIKEGATGNIIEDNICSNQLDDNSGCYDSRGDGNTFRYNVGSDCLGAGVRLGGWEVDGHQYGVGNSVYGNDFSAVGHGAIKVLVSEQGDICGNTCEDGSCSLTGSAVSDITETWNQACLDIGGPSTSGGTAPDPLTSSSSSSSSSSSGSTSATTSTSSSTSSTSSTTSSSSSTGEDGSASTEAVDDDEISAGGSSSYAAPQSGGGGDDDVILADEEMEEEEEEEQEGGEISGESSSTSASDPNSDSDDYGNDNGDDFDGDDDISDDDSSDDSSDDDSSDDDSSDDSSDDDKEDDDDTDTTPTVTTSGADDYGNDYGDDFDANDDETQERRRGLRGGSAF